MARVSGVLITPAGEEYESGVRAGLILPGKWAIRVCHSRPSRSILPEWALCLRCQSEIPP